MPSSLVKIYQRDPDTWLLRIRQPDMRPQHRTVHGDRAAAEAAAASWAEEFAASDRLDPGNPRMLFGRWIREHLARRADLKPASQRFYRELLDRYIDRPKDAPPLAPRAAYGALDPAFSLGRRPLAKISLRDGLLFQDWLACSGAPAPTIHHCMRMVRTLLRAAARLGALPRDPWARLQIRRAVAAERHIPTQAEMRSIGRATTIVTGRHAKADPVLLARVQLLLDIGLATGCRRGEMLALRWRDIDLAAGTLLVLHTLEATAEGLVLAPPKTRRARRTISLPAALVERLTSVRLAAAELALASGKKLDDLPVLPDPRDGTSWWKPMNASQAAKRTLAYVGIANASLHTMRHSHASVLMSSRVSPRAVSARLGHASPGFTLNIYSHLMPSDDAVSTAVIEQALGKIA